MIYIKEAHPSGGWVSRGNTRAGITIATHRDYAERIDACTLAQSKLKIEMPALVDGMDDAVNKAYAASPDRLYLIDKDGLIAIKGARGPRGFAPSVDDARDWLATHVDINEN